MVKNIFSISMLIWCVGARAETVCVLEKPSALPGETVTVWVVHSDSLYEPAYAWKTSQGRVIGSGARILWNLSVVDSGEQKIAASINSLGKVFECSARLLVLEPANKRGEVGSSALITTEREGVGALKYGAYTYVLLAGPPPDETTRQRYLAVIKAWQGLTPNIRAWESYLPPDKLNVTFVPISAVAAENVNADWLLEHYDYARSKLILRKFKEQGRGPFLVTSLRPLTSLNPIPGETLVQNFSTVPASMASYWMESFLRQSSQERFWLEPARGNFVLQIRTLLESAGQAVGPVATAFADLKGLMSWK